MTPTVLELILLMQRTPFVSEERRDTVATPSHRLMRPTASVLEEEPPGLEEEGMEMVAVEEVEMLSTFHKPHLLAKVFLNRDSVELSSMMPSLLLIPMP